MNEDERLDHFAAHAPELPKAQVDAIVEDERKRGGKRTAIDVQCDYAWLWARTMIKRRTI